MLGLPETVHACLFDLDGVLTDTASVHTKAWKVMFDAFLQQHAEQTGEPFVPFDPVDDYLKYVDGKKREDGVRSFLASRGIELPDGDPDDTSDKDTVYGLGTRKNDAFQETLHKDGVKVFDGSRRYLEKVAAAGLATAVVSSSAEYPPGAGDHRARQVHPAASRRRHIARGTHRRQAGTGLVPACRRPAERHRGRGRGVRRRALRSAGGARGHFGYVVGVDRVGQADELRSHGADVVVTDLGDLL